MKRKLIMLASVFLMACTALPVYGVEKDGAAKAETLNQGYRGEALPKGPEKNGTIWTVTPENAQYTLDGAYGSIDGKTIHFGKGIYSKELVLARSTKYAGSNTIYYNMTWSQTTGWKMDAAPVELEELNSLPIKTYLRTIENVKLSADDGVILPGFSAGSGHVYQNAYDYVREIEVPNSNSSYYMNSSLKNVTFDGLTIQNCVVLNDYSAHAVNSGIHFRNCTFQGNKSNMGTNTYGAIRMMADSKHFENVTISNCTITNYFQGIYLQGADGAKITNNVIDGTRHNAIALQSSATNQVQGDVLIAENIIKNVEDRVIRFGYAQQAEQISMKNNIIVNSGDSDGELFKGESFPDSEKVSLEHNYWDGRSVEIAIASKNEELRPEKTGIAGGSFPEEIKPEYCSDGFVPTANKDGTYGVCNHEGTEREMRNARKPTCVEKGYTGDIYCANCGSLLETGKELEAIGEHSNQLRSDADAHWYECIDCGLETGRSLHTFQWVIDKEATKTQKGSKHEECSVCGYRRAAVEIPIIETEEQAPAVETPTQTTGNGGDGSTDSTGNRNANHSSNGRTDSAKTGDNGNPGLWLTLLLLAAGALAGTGRYGKRSRAE